MGTTTPSEPIRATVTAVSGLNQSLFRWEGVDTDSDASASLTLNKSISLTNIISSNLVLGIRLKPVPFAEFRVKTHLRSEQSRTLAAWGYSVQCSSIAISGRAVALVSFVQCVHSHDFLLERCSTTFGIIQKARSALLLLNKMGR